MLRARELGISVKVIHNASIMSAIGSTGLQLYNFGQTVSMVFFTESWKPSSFYDRIAENKRSGLHTLILLDIKVKEQSLENLMKGRQVYDPPRYMTIAQCARQMLEIEEARAEHVYGPKSLAVGIARLGSDDEKTVAGTLEELTEADLGEPLHSLILLGYRVHDLEKDFVIQAALDVSSFEAGWLKLQQSVDE